MADYDTTEARDLLKWFEEEVKPDRAGKNTAARILLETLVSLNHYAGMAWLPESGGNSVLAAKSGVGDVRIFQQDGEIVLMKGPTPETVPLRFNPLSRRLEPKEGKRDAVTVVVEAVIEMIRKQRPK